MKNLHIIFSGRYGLSNRVRSMAGHYALASVKGLSFSYEWIKDPSCPGNFSDLFNCRLVDNSERSAVTKLPDDLWVTYKTQPTHCGSHPSSIEKEYNLDKDESIRFNEIIKEFYENLVPVESIKKSVNSLFLNKKDKILGVHLRRTDMIDHCIKMGIEPPSDAELHKQINHYFASNPKSLIILSADNPDSEFDFMEKYKNKVLVLRKNWDISKTEAAGKSNIQERLSSLEEAVADLYALSKCSYIIGTKHSSFSTFAAIWGAINYIRV